MTHMMIEGLNSNLAILNCPQVDKKILHKYNQHHWNTEVPSEQGLFALSGFRAELLQN